MANGNVKTENGKPQIISKSREKVHFHYAERAQVQAHECG